MLRARLLRLLLILALAAVAACSDDADDTTADDTTAADPDAIPDAADPDAADPDADDPDADDTAADPDAADPDATDDADATPSGPTTFAFDLDADVLDPARFFDLPYPSDLTLTPGGTTPIAGLPNPFDVPLFTGLKEAAATLPGFPQVPVAWLRASGPLAPRDLNDVIAATPDAPILLIDVDPTSPERGRLIPVIAHSLPADPYTPEHTLALAARPGFVLAPSRAYAFVVMNSLGDAAGAPLAAPPALAALARGETPPGALGAAAVDLYTPLWTTLDALGLDPEAVAMATVFTTGDAPSDLHALTEWAVTTYTPPIEDLVIAPDDGADHPRFCELHATLTLPQFQVGEPPFNTDGLFALGPDGHPVEQRLETIPVVVTLPRRAMPPGGFPLVLYFHGSGGLSTQVVDRGRIPGPGEPETPGEGPAHVLAAHGFATASSALPVNPERLPGADALAYLNFNNLKAFRDTFRQGVLEQRLLLHALLRLSIDPAAIAACDLPAPPGGAFFFTTSPIFAMGQSMGGMYTNMVGAVEPAIQAVVPTGAGGFWSYFILETSLVPGVEGIVATLLQTRADLTHLHPVLHTLQTAWEPAEPMVYMPRLAHDPLPRHPTRPIYQPIGQGDSYFPTVVFDAVTLAFQHQQAGDPVWPSLQDALALADLDGLLDYPVQDNLTSTSGRPYTGVAVQFEGDGFSDPHTIFSQLDAVKYQYGCFFERLLTTSEAVVVAPQPLGTPCF